MVERCESWTSSVQSDALTLEVLAIVAGVTLADPKAFDGSAQLEADLGVESIDLLDILYEMEERFSISIGAPPPFLDRAFFDDESGHVSAGGLTASGRALLRSHTYLSTERLESDQAVSYLGSVQSLVDLARYHML